MVSPDFVTPGSTQPAIGIDLGTTYSAIAYLDASGRPITISNDSGDLLTPSAVAFDDDTVLVGKEAVKSAVFDPQVFADCFKRDMGRRSFRRLIAETAVPPEVLSGFILRQLKLDAERRLGCEINEAVITVPAFFDETRRRATQEAGRIAGLKVLDLINEPTAAAITFGYQRAAVSSDDKVQADEKVLVYDLGGGTFDVTVLEIKGQSFRALATDGDVQLGGRDFDERLMCFVAEKFQAVHGVDPRSDPHDAAQLWHDVQEAKHALTQRQSMAIPCTCHGIRLRVDVSRAEFERMTIDLLDRTETTTQLALRAAKLDWGSIDRVLLVGGATRMPAVGAMLKRCSGMEPDRSLSPDEAVAHGAAIYAGMISAGTRKCQQSQFSLVNVNSHSLGVVGIDQRAKCKRNVVLIPRNTPLPAKVVRKFATARDNQNSVKVVVVEGESEKPEHCIRLGECVVRNLPPSLPKGTKIEVEYCYSTSGRLAVRARIPAARQSAAVEIQYDQALHIPDLDSWHDRIFMVADSLPNESSSDIVGLEDEVERLVQQLEELHVSYGKKAMDMSLSSTFDAEQRSAIAAFSNVKVTTKRYLECERQRQAAVGQAEILAANAALTKASLEVEESERKNRDAQYALGKKCVALEYVPEQLSSLYAEIKRLQSV